MQKFRVIAVLNDGTTIEAPSQGYMLGAWHLVHLYDKNPNVARIIFSCPIEWFPWIGMASTGQADGWGDSYVPLTKPIELRYPEFEDLPHDTKVYVEDLLTAVTYPYAVIEDGHVFIYVDQHARQCICRAPNYSQPVEQPLLDTTIADGILKVENRDVWRLGPGSDVYWHHIDEIIRRMTREQIV